MTSKTWNLKMLSMLPTWLGLVMVSLHSAQAEPQYEFRAGKCQTQANNASDSKCDPQGRSSPGGFCELVRTPETQDPDIPRVYRFQVPATAVGGKKSSGPVYVTMRARRDSGLIDQVDVSLVANNRTEIIKSSKLPAEFDCSETDPATGEPLCSIKVISNPKQEEALQLLKAQTRTDAEFDSDDVASFAVARQINNLIKRAGLEECDFYQKHLTAGGGGDALTEVGVQQFFQSCQSDDPTREASQTGLGCQADAIESALGLPIQEQATLVALSNKELNLSLIQELRSGLLKTLTALRLSDPSAKIPDSSEGQTWTKGMSSAACGAGHNQSIDKEIQTAHTSLSTVPAAERSNLERDHMIQTAVDLLEWQQRQCANTFLQNASIFGGKGNRRDRQRVEQLEGENKVLKMMDQDTRKSGYSMVYQALFSGSEKGLFGLEPKMFEDRYACGNPVNRHKLMQLQESIRKREDASAPFLSRLVSPSSDFYGFVKSVKTKQMKTLAAQLSEATALCEKASEKINAGWFADSGLALWNNRTLVEAVVRKRLASGEDISLMAEAYCTAKSNFDRQTSKEQKAILGMTGAALLAAPVVGVFEVGGTAAYAIYGLGVGSGIAGAGLSARDANRSYDDLLMKRMALSAGFASNQEVRDAQSQFHSSLVLAAVDLGFTGIDVVGLSKNLGQALTRGKYAGLTAAEVDQALVRMTEDIKTGKISRDQLEEFARRCQKRAADCTTEMETRLASLAEPNVGRMASPQVPQVKPEIQAQLRSKTELKAAYSNVPSEHHGLVDAIAVELYRKHAPSDYRKLLKGELVPMNAQVRKELDEITSGCKPN